mgnify:CR=1 FL=1
MKKGFLAIAAAAALVLSSCGDTKKNAEAAAGAADQVAAVETVDTAALSDDTNAAIATLTAQVEQAVKNKDPKVLITSLATLQATYKALVNAGQLDEAKAYGQSIKNFLAENAESIKAVTEGNTTIADLVNGIKNLPTTAETTAEQAKQAVTDDAVNLAAPYIQKAAQTAATVEAAKAALQSAPEAAKKIVENVPEVAKEAAKTAAEKKANEEVTKAQNKANEKVNEAREKAAEKVKEGQKKLNDKVNEAAHNALKNLGK